MLKNDYLIREAEESEISYIISLLEMNYFNEENISQNYFTFNKSKITEEDERLLKEDLKKMFEHSVANAIYLVAVHVESKKIVGVIIPILSENPHLSTAHKTETFAIEKLWKSKALLDFYQYITIIDKDVDIFKTFPEAKVGVKLRYLYVDKNHRRKGLSRLLIKKTIEYSKEKGYDVVYGTFSSSFSRKAAENLGLKNIKDFDLLTFRDSDGSPVFADDTPNNVISIMALALNE